MHVGITGASGLVGQHLAAALRKRGDSVVTASLRDPAKAAAAVAQCDVVVNLAGEPIAQRWSASVKEKIRASRVDAPRAFIDALSKLPNKPQAYISASAVGYYPPSETATYTEQSPPGDDFLGTVCAQWEQEARRASEFGMRVSIVRTGIVLSTDGGALKSLLPPFKLGAGGIIGNGRQWYSWIHIDDLTRMYVHEIDGATGIYNGTAPHPTTNAEFTKTIGHVLKRPTIVPTPTFALRMILGEGADFLLDGQRVMPEHALEDGFTFKFPVLEAALNDLLK
jgi:uncharacterized protein (TIGR01777 family)